MTDKKITILVIPGSVRPNNYTAMAVRLVADELASHQDVEFEVIDPLMLQMQLPGVGSDSSELIRFREKVQQSTGVIMATPEYHGSFSSVIKLVIENLGFPSVLSGKPIALMGVAAGAIGAIKSLEQLRGVCSHVGALVLPGPVSVPYVQQVFDQQGQCQDPAMEKRIRGVASHMLEHIRGHICPKVALEAMVRDRE